MSLDITTVGGLILCSVLIVMGILQGEGAQLASFIDMPSILIVVLGGTSAVAVCYPLNAFFGIVKII